MKKTISILCAVLAAALLFVLPITAFAAETTGSLGENITYVWDSETKTITVTGTGAMTDFTSGNYPFSAYAIWNNCTTVVIGEGITTIGSYAFNNLQKVTSLTIPSTVTEIHEGAFKNMKVLPQCNIPYGVTMIGKQAFYNCQKLANVTLPEGLLSIGEGAFYSCQTFTEVVIPPHVTVLPDQCFYQCWNVTSFIIPEGVTTAGQYVITGSSITEIYIPASVTSMLFDSFRDNGSLESFYVNENNPAYCDVDGVLYTKDKSVLMAVPYTREGALTVDPACLEIGPSAIDGCFGITAITLPDGLQKIGAAAFSSTSISSITIPASVTEMGGGVVSYCENLVYAEINANVADLGGNTFSGCPNLETVVLGPNVRGYGYACFRECSKLTSVTVIEGLTTIDEGCFNNCTLLTGFTIPETVTFVGDQAFDGCKNLSDLEIPAGLTYLGMYAFRYCPITEATIPEGITAIPGMVFQFCDQLKTVTVLGDLSTSTSQVVGSNAFGKCTALEAVYFKCPVLNPQRIAKNAFNGVDVERLEIHYLNIFPEWDYDRPFDTDTTAYNYVADIVATYVEGEGVELRERIPEDSRQDLRFIFRQINVPGSVVHSRFYYVINTENGNEVEMPSRRTYYVDPNGEYELFTLVITGISPKNFDTYLEVYAGIDVTANVGGYRNFLYTYEPIVASVNELLNKE